MNEASRAQMVQARIKMQEKGRALLIECEVPKQQGVHGNKKKGRGPCKLRKSIQTTFKKKGWVTLFTHYLLRCPTKKKNERA